MLHCSSTAGGENSCHGPRLLPIPHNKPMLTCSKGPLVLQCSKCPICSKCPLVLKCPICSKGPLVLLTCSKGPLVLKCSKGPLVLKCSKGPPVLKCSKCPLVLKCSKCPLVPEGTLKVSQKGMMVMYHRTFHRAGHTLPSDPLPSHPLPSSPPGYRRIMWSPQTSLLPTPSPKTVQP